jgi:hypothetical protein
LTELPPGKDEVCKATSILANNRPNMTDPAVGELPFAKVEVMIIKLRLKKIHQS